MSSRLRALVPYLLVLAASAFLIIRTAHFEFVPRGDRPGPDVWPRAILVLIVVTCVIRIINVLRARSSADAAPGSDVVDLPADVDESPAPTKRYPMLLAGGIALTVLYVALLSTLGFFIDTVLYIAALIRAGRYRRWPVIISVAVAGALVFMFVFMRVVYLSLPIGDVPFASVSLFLMKLMGIR